MNTNTPEKSNVKKKKLLRRSWVYILTACACVLIVGGYFGYVVGLKNNINGDVARLYIPTGTSFEGLKTIIERDSVLKNIGSFSLLSQLMGYDSVVAGYYEFTNPTDNIHIIRRLQSGKQTEVRLVINSSKTVGRIAKMISKAIEADSTAVANALSDSSMLKKYGLDDKNMLPTIVLPDTYFIYWTYTPEEVLDRLYAEYKAFWNADRLEKARKKDLTRDEVVALASIICLESNKADELPTIAGVYINRLKKGMPLQADPTVLFAVGDWSIRRVKGEHIRIKSPYNTYKNKGLPPTPISFPSKSAIDAVLNAEEHDYLYFCAKDDFSGYHAYAVSYKDHQINARKYHQALTNRNIK